jgi:alkanesulfonate monooxygenase SsuD/methylene tetrahydromethanopterin reductase-like flavin-dependent oxidoreductase (luciferase family)
LVRGSAPSARRSADRADGRIPRLILDIQLNQGALDWAALAARAQAAESAGFGAVWVFDHLAGITIGGDHMFEAFTLLGAIAASTETIELGTMVANINNRTPAVLALAAASVEAIAGRPFHLGIGSGTAPDTRWATEMHAVGQPIARTAAARHAALEHVLDTLERLWSPTRGPELATFPLPRRRPAVIVGAGGTELAAIAGRRASGVNVPWDHPRREELLAAAQAASGDRSDFLLTAWTTWDDALLDPDHPTRRAAAARGIERFVLLASADVSPERIAQTTVNA